MEVSNLNKLGSAEKYFTSDPQSCVKIFNSKSNESTTNFTTIPEIFAKTVELYPDRSALMYKKEKSKEWISISYHEYKERVEKVAKIFLKLGLEKKGRVAILAFNSVEWFISKLAAIYAGGQFVGIYNSNSAEACQYVLEKCRANIIVVDEDSQLEKILKVRQSLPHLKVVIKTMQSKNSYDNILYWNDMEEMDASEFEEVYKKNLEEMKSNSCCSLVFTSGTTGNPKGSMLSHDNIMFNVENVINLYGIQSAEPEVIVSYLPLSHIAGSLVDVFMPITVGATVYFADKNALKGTLINTLLDARPTFFFGVPRVYEKIHEKIFHTIETSKSLTKFLAKWAQSSALSHHMNIINGKMNLSITYPIFKNLVLNKLKAKVGLDRCRTLATGAAPFNIETMKFFLSLDLQIYEIYGMTESGVTFAVRPKELRLESTGKCFPGVEYKIFNPNNDGCGEICTRGRNSFMGYIDEIEKTRELIDDNLWLHSGDLGYIDKDGYLFIAGRIKELIVTAGGENIPFLNIENNVRNECSAISNAFLVGDKRKYLTMLITLKTDLNEHGIPSDNLSHEVLMHVKYLGLKYKLLSEIINAGPDPKILYLIREAINRANEKAISNAQKVQKFALLPQDFSQHTGEFGPTMKIKRNFVLEKYKNEINKLYA